MSAEELRNAIERAVYDSEDNCSRCKSCEHQFNAVMGVVWPRIDLLRREVTGENRRLVQAKQGNAELARCLSHNASRLRDIADGIDDDPRVRLKVIISALEYAAEKHGGPR